MRKLSPLIVTLISLFFIMTGCGTSKNKIKPSKEKHISAAVDTIPEKPELKEFQIKYGEILGVDPQSITNEKLYNFIDQWLDTPYLMGGESKEGIDCSFLAQQCYVDVYGYLLERTSGRMDQSKTTDKFRGQESLLEGDILFFKRPNTTDPTITHVGIYLINNKFLSASGYEGPEKLRGVKISDLNDPWWQERFMHAGRKPLSIYSTAEN